MKQLTVIGKIQPDGVFEAAIQRDGSFEYVVQSNDLTGAMDDILLTELHGEEMIEGTRIALVLTIDRSQVVIGEKAS